MDWIDIALVWLGISFILAPVAYAMFRVGADAGFRMADDAFDEADDIRPAEMVNRIHGRND
jgi:hypothetical protein